MPTDVYASLAEFLALPQLDANAPVDDTFIEALLTRCSREFDGDTGHWFYAHQQTRRFDVPAGRCLELDRPLLTVTALTNGDNSNITSANYDLTPFNGPHYTAIELHPDSAVLWLPTTGGRTRGVVYVAGTWGYVDRTATAPESATAISNSKAAVLHLALALYKKRYGVGVEGIAQVTAAGVVITPQDKSKDYWSIVRRYARLM